MISRLAQQNKKGSARFVSEIDVAHHPRMTISLTLFIVVTSIRNRNKKSTTKFLICLYLFF